MSLSHYHRFIVGDGSLSLHSLIVQYGCCCSSCCFRVISFMQGIYHYVPETNHVSGVYGGAGSVVTIYGTCNNISFAECFVLLHLHLHSGGD